MISKEEYVLNKVKMITKRYIKEDRLINPMTLDNLIAQWLFDYDMEKEHRPEVLKK